MNGLMMHGHFNKVFVMHKMKYFELENLASLER